MSAGDRLTRDGAERLLRGAEPGSRADPDPLVRLLAAASVRPCLAEPENGEEAALALFRDACRAPVPARKRPAGPVLVRLLTAKAVVVVLAAATGGAALAAGVVSLSGAQRVPSPQGGSAAPTAFSSASPRPSPSTPPSTPSRTAAVGSGPSPSPRPAELCRAYRVFGSDRREALYRPAFAPLVAAAGGERRVAGYCAELLRGARAAKAERGRRAVDPGESAKNKATTKKPAKTPNPNSTRNKGGSAKERFDRI